MNFYMSYDMNYHFKLYNNLLSTIPNTSLYSYFCKLYITQFINTNYKWMFRLLGKDSTRYIQFGLD